MFSFDEIASLEATRRRLLGKYVMIRKLARQGRR
jgi:hypothetical protein